MKQPERPRMEEIAERLCALTVRQVGPRYSARVGLDATLIDLDLDSLDFLEWVMEIEEHFEISIPETPLQDQAVKEVFTREDFRLRDMVEIIHLRWGSGESPTVRERRTKLPPGDSFSNFTQLGGRLDEPRDELHRALGRGAAGFPQHRRLTDGMTCVELPGGEVEIGCEATGSGHDERPLHSVTLSPFLIDIETVSVTAYCRFLNSIGEVDEETLRAWFLVLPDERRVEHQLLERGPEGWRAKPGTAEWPMVLVSWHGAHAYALWAAGCSWRHWEDDSLCLLPSEAEWEYAARGPRAQLWPWGDLPPEEHEVNAGFVRPQAPMTGAADLPLWPVHADPAPSTFGLRQMAGNVWEWCRDWYRVDAYASREKLTAQDPVENTPTGVRSERGGSWVGPVSLTRSSYRRARAPHARGRCLGFRCVHPR